MKEKSYFVSGTKELLDVFRKHKKPYSVKYFGKEWVILPNVFSPKYAKDAFQIVKWLPDIKGKEILEIGCGSGIIPVEVAFRRAKKVVATDININAVENAKLNAKKHNVSNIVDVRQGNLFNPIKKSERFDLIIFNLPWGLRNKPISDILDKAMWDYDYLTQKNFLKGAKNHLKNNGKILICFSSIGHIGALKKNAKNCGYSIREINRKELKQSCSNKKYYFILFELIPK